MKDIDICHDCKKQVDTRMDNGDGKVRCVACSLEKYKSDCPYTWNLSWARKPSVNLMIKS